MDPITQKQAVQTGNKTSSPGSLLLSDIQAPGSNHGSPYWPRDPGVWRGGYMMPQRKVLFKPFGEVKHVVKGTISIYFEMHGWEEVCSPVHARMQVCVSVCLCVFVCDWNWKIASPSRYYRRQPDLYPAFSSNVLDLVQSPQRGSGAGETTTARFEEKHTSL